MREILADVLLALAVPLVVICAIGVLVMKDVYQRLHFLAPPATLSAFALTAAVGLHEWKWAPTLKVLFVSAILAFINGVVTHATARAARVREVGGLSPASPDRPEIRTNRDEEERPSWTS